MSVETEATPAAGAASDPDTISWKAKGVHVAQIDRELSVLWKADAEKEGGEHHPVTRTRVLNFVAITTSSDNAGKIRETVGKLMGQHPSRTIIVISHPGDEGGVASLDAEIEAHRQSTGAECDVSWELVTLKTRGRTAFHLASVVTPLLVTDLPTFIWWAGEPPFESELFEHVVDICDRMMVDSLSFLPPYEKDLPKLAKLVRKRGNTVAFSDFNWVRIRPWVEFTTQFFDPPAYRPYMNGIDRITIEYEADRDDPNPNPCQGILFTGWIASRLEWEVRPGKKRLPHGGWSLPMANVKAGKTIDVDIQSKEAHKGASGEIFKITVDTSWLGKKARFSIARSDDRLHATTTIETEGQANVVKVVEFESDADADLLVEELHIVDRDRAYEGALDMASLLIGGPKPPAPKAAPKAKKGGAA